MAYHRCPFRADDPLEPIWPAGHYILMSSESKAASLAEPGTPGSRGSALPSLTRTLIRSVQYTVSPIPTAYAAVWPSGSPARPAWLRCTELRGRPLPVPGIRIKPARHIGGACLPSRLTEAVGAASAPPGASSESELPILFCLFEVHATSAFFSLVRYYESLVSKFQSAH